MVEGKCPKVCRLKKAIYDLKQSPRPLFERFSKAVQEFGFTISTIDHSICTMHKAVGFIIIIVYVDDILLTGTDAIGIEATKKFLHFQFVTKNMGMINYFLGIKVQHVDGGLVQSQRKYVLDMLKETRMLGCKPASIPMDSSPLANSESPLLEDVTKYHAMVGKLLCHET
jgi:hypothetical protein